MQPEISEFSFGFAITNELVQQYSFAFVGAPEFLTQKKEGELGYDVSLPRSGIPLFLQFKRSVVLVRRNAGSADQLGVPHYRMHLRPTRFSDQHSALLNLEQKGEEVYYVAPRFSTYEELNERYLGFRVAESSVFVKPSEIGLLPDHRDHHLDISEDGMRWLFCSREPRPIKSSLPDQVLRHNILEVARNRRTLMDEEYFATLGDQLVDRFLAYSGRPRDREAARAKQVRKTRTSGEYVREMAQMMYGCELLLVVPN